MFSEEFCNRVLCRYKRLKIQILTLKKQGEKEMKNWKKYGICLFLMMLIFCVAPQSSVYAASSQKTTSKKTTKRVGWYTSKGKTYYYKKNGKKKTGWLELDGKKYYFSKKGVMQTGWVEISGKYYYFNKKTGVLNPTKTKKKLSALEKYCKNIVNKTVKKTDSTSTKLKKLFNYVTYKYSYHRTYNFSPSSGWAKTKALNMFKQKCGNCYSYAAAFGYLAKKATGLPVRIYYGSTPGNSVAWTPHGWCEIKIKGTWRVFDPDLYRYVYKGSSQFYNTVRSSAYYKVGGYEVAKF